MKNVLFAIFLAFSISAGVWKFYDPPIVEIESAVSEIAVNDNSVLIASEHIAPSFSALDPQRADVIVARKDFDSHVASLKGATVKQMLESLEDIAMVNASAAAMLAHNLLPCGNLENRIKHRQDRAKLDLATPGLDDGAKATIEGQLERELSHMNKHCAGVTTDDVLQGHLFFERAAELGDLDTRARYVLGARAMIDRKYAFDHPEQVMAAKVRALRYAESAAQAGSAEAMAILGEMYLSGSYATANDPVKGTAYFIAAVRHGREQLRGAMDRRVAQLGAADVAEAHRLANELLRKVESLGPQEG